MRPSEFVGDRGAQRSRRRRCKVIVLFSRPSACVQCVSSTSTPWRGLRASEPSARQGRGRTRRPFRLAAVAYTAMLYGHIASSRDRPPMVPRADGAAEERLRSRRACAPAEVLAGGSSMRFTKDCSHHSPFASIGPQFVEHVLEFQPARRVTRMRIAATSRAEHSARPETRMRMRVRRVPPSIFTNSTGRGDVAVTGVEPAA